MNDGLEEACVHVPQRVVESRWDLAGWWLCVCCLLRSCGDAVMQRNSWTRDHTSCCLLIHTVLAKWS